MTETLSDTPKWEPWKLPTDFFPAKSSILCQAKISEEYLVILAEKIDPTYIQYDRNPEREGLFSSGPKIKYFSLFNINTLTCTKINEQNIDKTLSQASSLHTFRMFNEGNGSLICVQESSTVFIWKFKLTPDFKTITSVGNNVKSGNRPTFLENGVLYSNKLWFLVFPSTPSTPSLFSQKRNEEPQLVSIDTESGQATEHSIQGSKPHDTVGYCTILYENQLYYFGGRSPSVDNYYRTMWILNLDTLRSSEIYQEASPCTRCLAEVSVYADKIYMFSGGKVRPGASGLLLPKELFVFDTAGQTWQNIEANTKDLPDFFAPMFVKSGGPFKMIVFKERILLISKESSVFFLPRKQLAEQQCQANEEPSLLAKQKILFTEMPFPDITFIVEEKEIPAHKGVLYAGSKFFRNMFTNGMEESTKKTIEISDIKIAVFKAMLEYIYCSTVEVNKDIAWDLFEVADKYSLPGLKKTLREPPFKEYNS